MVSPVNTVKWDITEALCGGAVRSAKEIAALTSRTERTVRKALSEMAEKGIVQQGKPEGGEDKELSSCYFLTPGLISIAVDLSASPVVFHVCRLYSGNVTSVVYEAPDRCEKNAFLSGIARNISSYIEKSFPKDILTALSFLYNSSSPLPDITPPDKGSGVKMFFWSKDELAAVISSREVKSELTLYIDLSGEHMKAFVFRPNRRYEVPVDNAVSGGDSEKEIIKKVSALYRAFRPDVIYISDPFGGERLENGIRNALDGEFPEHGAFCSELFSHSFEKKLINEAARLAMVLL